MWCNKYQQQYIYDNKGIDDRDLDMQVYSLLPFEDNNASLENRECEPPEELAALMDGS